MFLINPYRFDSVDPGLLWLQQNASPFLDFLNIEAANATAIQSSDAGLLDIGPNGIDASPVNGIVSANFLGAACIKDLNDDGVSLTIAEVLPYLEQDFELGIIFHAIDGRLAAGSYNLCGAITDNTSGARKLVNIFVNSAGTLIVQYAATSGLMNWQSSAAVVEDHETELIGLRIRFDFTTNALTVKKRSYTSGTESTVTGAFITGGDNINISAINPANLNLTHNFYIGSLNNVGTAGSNTNYIKILRFGIWPITITQDAIDYFYDVGYEALFSSKFHITAANATAKRDELIDIIFPEGTLPTNAVPSATDSVSSGTIHGIAVADIVGDASITRLTFVRDGVSNKCYHIVNSSPNGELLWHIIGHGGLIGDLNSVNRYLAEGYDVILADMPVTGEPSDVTDNTVTAGPWTPSTVANHNEMVGLGTDGFQYFLFDKIECMNYLKANFAYTHIYPEGISGGGWTVVWLAALDERFEKSFCTRGAKPSDFRLAVPDYEQGPNMEGDDTNCGAAVKQLYTDFTWFDLFSLCTTNGRLFKMITHDNESADLGGKTFNMWTTRMQNKAIELGGTYELYLNNVVSEATHQVYTRELDEVINEL